VDLLVSDGPAPRVVPDGLVGASRSSAVAALEGIQLVPQVTEQYSDTVSRGVVLSSAVAPGTEVPRGSAVGLVVSAGPRPIVVPDVSGRSGSEAASVLEAAGFTVSGIEGSPTGAVIATDPVAGESRQPGAAVRIFTRR
jgi:serine/threonine-protein kinase